MTVDEDDMIPDVKYTGKWVVGVLGEPLPYDGAEIFVHREDNKWAIDSWGWFGDDKRLISTACHGCGVEPMAWDGLIAVAQSVADRLNAADREEHDD